MKKSQKNIVIVTIAISILIAAGKLFLDSIYTPVIIMYHSVDKKGLALDSGSSKLNVKPKTFAKQMKFLNDHGYKVIPLAEFIERIKNGKKIPRKTVAITFDDGLKNNFVYAWPVLERYGFPATVFVATEFVGREGFLTWDDIKIMQKDNISIGSHTMSHSWLPSLDDKDILRELFGSKQILEDKTGQKIEILSYPLGGFNKEVKKLAEKTGYIGAVATNPGRGSPKDDIYALKRIRISMTSDNLFNFWVETSGYYTFIKEIRDED